MAFVEIISDDGKKNKVFASAIAIEQLMLCGNKKGAQQVADAYFKEAMEDLQSRFEFDKCYIKNQVLCFGLKLPK